MQLLVNEKQSKEIKFKDYKALSTSLSFQADDFFTTFHGSKFSNFSYYQICKSLVCLQSADQV